ncbi:Smr/MutS family protein [Roseospira goensis]|uniref:DNA-nicking Smr family endonuclease n=1 Tax=Roseospira goensis TaxID=391922 RepID=A0A7W6S0C5_9PROT|nr:Smr/MutS family protein [Roseospira goensis]MBB4286535.1 DNA-nicking Smr family endonuclease [Roseospira goensis]
MTTRTPPPPDRRGRAGKALISDSDLRLWQEVTRSATPLPGRPPPASAAPPPAPAPAPATSPDAAPPPSPTPTAARPAAPPRAPSREIRPGDGAGIDRRTHDRFRRGRMAIEGRLDLHGMTRERAHQALSVFLHRAYERGARCVLVVTGKGTGREGSGVLRRDVPHWLNQGTLRGLVLSFTHAQIRDGGEGALYVLLRRRRDRGPAGGGRAR